MPEKLLYEYAVIRFVPRVEREEFLNVGIVLYCPVKRYLGMLYEVNVARIEAAFPGTDLSAVSDCLVAFEKICTAAADAAAIGGLPAPQRFRWLTATRSTIVQLSKVHPGFCDDPGRKLAELFAQLVQPAPRC